MNHSLPTRWALPLALALCTLAPGCAAITNPLVDSPPVKNAPPELAPLSLKDKQESLPLAYLGQPVPDAYRLDTGDVLGIWIEGVLGELTYDIPIHLRLYVAYRQFRNLPPSVGYPIAVAADGTITLPLIDPLPVRGLSLTEAELAVRQAYVRRGVLPPGRERIFVTMMQKRQYEIVVLRQEAAAFGVGPNATLTTTGKRGTGQVLYMNAYENDVLHALAQTGGLPGLDAYNEVIIMRRRMPHAADRKALVERLQQQPADAPWPAELLAGCSSVHIPLRQVPGQPLPVRPEDVVLQTGDVVYLEARDRDVYYTAGLLPTSEHVLPRDRDLDVVSAVSLVKGPLVNASFSGSSLFGSLVPAGLGQPSASLLVVLRRTEGGGQVPIRIDLNRALRDPRERIIVRPGDVLILQEAPGEAIARYATQTFSNFNILWQPIHTRFVRSVLDIAAPDRVPGGRGLLSNFNAGVQNAQQIQQAVSPLSNPNSR